MSTKLTTESFLGLIKQSGLIDQDQLKKLWKEIKDQGVATEDYAAIANELVSRNALTRWQVDKLLQGKHKGFFLGKYRLLSHLGTGGMSSVYLAEHVLMRRRVAIKVLPQARVDDTSYLQRFHREAQAVAALDHRNIVRAYDVDQEGKVHFLVMEYVAGTSLQDLVMKDGMVPYVTAAEYIRQAAEGLSHAHRAGMVHRDIKPGNLLTDEKGVVKLLDLGLARFFGDEEENSLTIKHDEKVLGTADYLAPEQALDSHTVDIRADIYSLGCTLYFMLTGHPPFPQGTMAQRLMAHQTKQPAPISADRSDVPESLVAIVTKMMAKQVDDRYQTARETADVLLQWLMENGGSAWAQMNPYLGGSSSLISGSTMSSMLPETAEGAAGSGSKPLSDLKKNAAGKSGPSGSSPGSGKPGSSKSGTPRPGSSKGAPGSGAGRKPATDVAGSSGTRKKIPPPAPGSGSNASRTTSAGSAVSAATAPAGIDDTSKSRPESASLAIPQQAAPPVAGEDNELAAFFSSMAGAEQEPVGFAPAPVPEAPAQQAPGRHAAPADEAPQFPSASVAPAAPAAAPQKPQPVAPTPPAAPEPPGPEFFWPEPEPEAAPVFDERFDFDTPHTPATAPTVAPSSPAGPQPQAAHPAPPAAVPIPAPPASSAPPAAVPANPVPGTPVPATPVPATPVPAAPVPANPVIAATAVPAQAAPVQAAVAQAVPVPAAHPIGSPSLPEQPPAPAKPLMAAPVAPPVARAAPVTQAAPVVHAAAVVQPPAPMFPADEGEFQFSPSNSPAATMLAEPVQPSTKSSVQPSAASTKQKLSGLLANKNARIGIGAGAVLLIAILVYSLMGGKKPPTGAGKPGKKGTTKKTIVADDSPPKLKPAARTLGKIKQEWVVGSGAGEFKSLREAIENTKKFPNDHRRATQVIKVPGGRTFAERIVIDSSYPPGIQIEVQEGQESILAPGGAEPIVELKGNYDRFRLQGFRLDASGKESAIKLSGFLGAAQFKQLKIDGFTRSGIVVEGATAYGTEGEAIMLDGLTLSAANPQATGILFSKGADNPSHVEVRRCRFSAMQIGAAFETDASFVWVSESLFIKTPVGIKLDGTGRTWRDLEFSNNTFFENDRGILITNMPSSGSSGFGFYNNLFVGLKGPSVIVEQDYKDIAFAGMYNTIGSGVSNNWTDSATAPVPGEVNIFTASGGRRDVKDLQFVSRDPNSPDFLVPAPTSPHKAVGTINPKKFGNQIGALKPK